MKYEICRYREKSGIYYAIAWTDCQLYGMDIIQALTHLDSRSYALRDIQTGNIIFESRPLKSGRYVV